MSAGLTVRRGGPEDLPNVMRMAAVCSNAPQWSAATWRKVMLSATTGIERTVLVAEVGGALVGFGVAGAAADEAEIESVAVESAYRRQGVGRRLCEELMRWAGERGVARIVLEVRASNLPARRLYESLGFREEGLRRHYYSAPEEDAVVMGLALVARQEP